MVGARVLSRLPSVGEVTVTIFKPRVSVEAPFSR
jgi:hypothetical protein